jgi:hypothetical protein
MDDNSGTILTGLYLYGEAQRKAQDAQYEADSRNKALVESADELQALNEKAVSLNGELEDEISSLRRQRNHIYQEFIKERDYRNEIVDKHDALLEENIKLKSERESQMLLLADWMVSQKAFKELSIQYGLMQGLSVEEVLIQGKKKELDVLESKHDVAHNTNADNSSVIKPRINQLKEKIISQE